MADQPVTREKLINADIDVDNLGKAVNEETVVTPRYGNPYKSMPMIAREYEANGATRGFNTLAEFEAVKATIPAHSVITIGEDGPHQGQNFWDGATLTKSPNDPLTQGIKYSSALFSNENLDISKKFDSIIRDFLKSSTPISGNYSESTSLAQENQNSPNTLYVLPNPFPNGAKIGQLALHSLTGSGTITLKAFTLSNGAFTVSRILKDFDIYKVGVNLFNFSEAPITINNGEYIGFQTIGSAKGVVTVSAAQEIESIKYYANPNYTGNTVPAANQGKSYFLNIALYTETFNNVLKEKLNGLDKTINTLSEYIYTDTYGTVLEPALKSKQSVLAHLIVNKLGPTDIKLFKIYAQQAGRIKVGVYSRSGDIFTRLNSQNFNLVAGLNTFTLDIQLGSNEYIGVQVLDAGVVAFSDALEGANSTFVSTSTAETFTPTLNSVNAFQFQFLAKPKETESEKKWLGKKYTSFGDSITWYNGRTFATSHIEAGQIVKGYQSYIVDALGCTLDNKGESGWDMTQIYASRILPYDFSDCYLTTITSGANDCRKGVPVGTLQPIGSTFNTSTYAGAMQASIEKVITSNPNTKIVLITPIRGWYSEYNTTNVPNTDPTVVGVLKREYPEMVKAIAKLYGVPVVDFYDELGWNDLNKYVYLGDDPAKFTAYLLHPNNKGYQRMGELLLDTLKAF